MRAARIVAELLGATWESVSTPFVRVEDGRVVSHVGLLALPLHVMGRAITVGRVHGVATHPDFRRRGYYRALMEELLPYADERYPTLVLTTAHPEYFEPFSFRAVPEQVFTTAVRSRNSPARLRAIDVADPADRRMVHRLLESRAPLSEVLGVGADQAVFAFNEVRGPLWHSDRLDCLMLLDRSGTRLRLYEVIGPRVPSLEALLEVVAGEVEEGITFFPPDRLCPPAWTR